MKFHIRFGIALLATVAVPLALAGEKPSAVMPKQHLAVLENYCFDCHDTETEKGNVNLEKLSFTISQDIPTAERWSHILNAINSGEMPPAKKRQISPAEKTAFLKDLSEQMVIARKVLSDSGGVIALRRLNRREYANTVEDLLGVRPDVSDLPDDQATSGFDTQGGSLFMSSDQIENYLVTARQTLSIALHPRKTLKKKTIRVEPEKEYTPRYAEAVAEMKHWERQAKAFLEQDEKPASAFGLLDAYQAKKRLVGEWIPLLDGYLARPETKTGATLIVTIKQGGPTRINLPSLPAAGDGKYTIRVRAAVYPDAEERFRYLEFTSADGRARKLLGWRKVTGTLENPQIIEFPIEHPPGKKLNYYIHQRTHQDRGDKNLATLAMRENGVGTKPGLWVDWAEMEGPEPQGPMEGRAAEVLFSKPDDMTPLAHSKEVIRRFAERAFRGQKPDPEFLKRLEDRFAANRAKGMKQVEALIEPLAIVLSSPSFLYMVESVVDEASSKLSDSELAVRLSYFLWSSPPDDELAQVAQAGRLSDPTVLKAQTNRLLADKKADRFVRGFVHQWLEMERLDMFQFKALLFPTFDNSVRENAREEIFETVHTLLAEKLPLRNLLKADFVVLNDLLAGYYDLPGVEGHEYRKVPLPAGSRRGGLLGTVAVAAMGSDGLRTSPVERGAWVLRYLLNDPPPPAPANVPMLSRLDGTPLSSRDRQRLHQEEPQCAQCHQKIDPIGFALENFNADGLWRETETIHVGRVSQKSKTVEFPIDPSGEEFEGYSHLRNYVVGEVDRFARGLTESLITYGLGRPYGFTDDDLANEILKKAQANDYELSLFVHALIQSEVFQTK